MRERVTARIQASAPREPLLSAPPVRVLEASPAGSSAWVSSNLKKNRWKRQQPRSITGGARGYPTAQACSLPPVMAQTGTGAKSTSSLCDQWTAAGDLLELERHGLRVAWPSPPRTSARPAEPALIELEEPAPARPAEPAPEVAAALRELEELRDCGLAVRWPR